MRTTIDVPDELLRRVKAVAALRGVKLKELVTSFLELGLNSQQTPQVSEKPGLPTFEVLRDRPIRNLSNAEIERILTEEDIRLDRSA